MRGNSFSMGLDPFFGRAWDDGGLSPSGLTPQGQSFRTDRPRLGDDGFSYWRRTSLRDLFFCDVPGRILRAGRSWCFRTVPLYETVYWF